MDRKSDKLKSGSGEEIVVFSVVRASQCTECGSELWKGSLLRLEGEKALCMGCADLDRLEFLPAGEAAVTRRASQYSTLRPVVVRWSRARNAMRGRASWSRPKRFAVRSRNHWRTRKSGLGVRHEPPNAAHLRIMSLSPRLPARSATVIPGVRQPKRVCLAKGIPHPSPAPVPASAPPIADFFK